MDKKAYLFFTVGMLFFFGCQRQSDMQDRGASFLYGVWVQDSIPAQDQLLSYTLHEFRFVCDSLYSTMHMHAKTQRIPDSCYRNGEWTEYAKAVYVVREDSLIVEGIYTKADGKQKISGCYKAGQYLPRFKIVHHTADSLVLESKFESRAIILRKVADVACVPRKRWEM